MEKGKFVVLFVSLFLTNTIYANEGKMYTCIVDNVYTMGDGMSSEKDGRKLLVTINDNNVVINSDIEGIDSGDLRLLVRSDIEIVAINKTMQYSYSLTSNKFSLTTGIGKSKFKPGVGHYGDQMLVYGLCTNN